ncbi:MAG: hypothetical protein RIS76_3680 [Verrucomicrobiota bacterium]
MLGIWRPVLWANNNEPVTLFCVLGAVDLAKVDLANLRYFFASLSSGPRQYSTSPCRLQSAGERTRKCGCYGKYAASRMAAPMSDAGYLGPARPRCVAPARWGSGGQLDRNQWMNLQWSQTRQ